MGRNPSRILRRQDIAPFAGERLPERDEFGRRERECRAPAERLPAGRREAKWALPAGDRAEVSLDGGEAFAPQGMEQRQMSRNPVAFGREVAPTQLIEAREGCAVEYECKDEWSGAGLRPLTDQNFRPSRASSSCAIAASISCWTL